ncbi:hypothetical protein C8F01DRAFT_1230633 [Mycena amicta]|nr:hypothetical protein C8F01DRAFT_1230633 [Mycena amicta]
MHGRSVAGLYIPCSDKQQIVPPHPAALGLREWIFGVGSRPLSALISHPRLCLLARLIAVMSRWFAETFVDTTGRSQAEGALAASIEDVIQDISRRVHLPDAVSTELVYADNRLMKTRILFRYLDAQAGNAGLVHAFQHAVLKCGGIDNMLNPQLLVTVEGQTLPHHKIPAVQNKVQFIRNCPLPSKFFQGREDILKHLHSLFQPTDQTEQKVVLLYGLGGAGKTQTALKFIADSDSGSRFTDQFKIHASSKETIEASYKQIALDKNLGDTAKAAMTWLQGNQEEWLILLDNADTRGMDLRPHIPKCGHGNILITSRNPDLWVHTGPHNRTIQISDLSSDDAAMLLLNTAGVGQTADNKKHAAAIAQELYCFPLAIVQAGAFISKSPHLKENMFEYVQLYRDKTAELLSEKAIQSTDDYKESVYTTWRMSFSQLAQAEPLAVQFLQLCSFIHCEGITEEIFERASKYKHRGGPLGPTQKALKPSLKFLSKFQNSETSLQKPGLKCLSRFRKRDSVWDKIVFQKMTSEICGYSLMAWQNNAYSIHPLVHQWSRTTMKDLVGQRRLMINLLGMAAACSNGVVQELQLLLHLVQLSKDIELVSTGFEATFGHVFWTGGIFERAENFQARMLARSRTVLGDEHRDSIAAMSSLGATYKALGRYTDTLKLAEQVLEKRTKLLSAEHPDTIKAMANLAATYHSLGRYTDALKLKEQVLEKRTKLLTAEHPDTVRAMAELAAIYHSLGRYTDALKLKEQVLEKRTKLLTAEHPDTVEAMANLAATYHSLGRYTDALKLKEQVLEKRTKLLSAEHPDTVQAMANLTATYHSLGRYTDALKLAEQVLEKRTKLLTAEHPDTVHAMANLAATYHSLGRYTDALKLKEQVLEKQTKLLSAEHPDTVRAMANLAAIYHSLGRYTDALKLEEQVLEKRTKLLTAEHPDTVHAMADLATTYHSLGRYTDAERLDEQVVEKRTKLLTAEHPDTVEAMANLATTYHSLGRYTDALKLKEQVLEKQTKLLSAEHPDTVRAMANLAATYHSLGRYTDALKLKEQVLEKRTKLLTAEHPDTVKAMANLGATYHSLGRYTDAERLKEQVLEKQGN